MNNIIIEEWEDPRSLIEQKYDDVISSFYSFHVFNKLCRTFPDKRVDSSETVAGYKYEGVDNVTLDLIEEVLVEMIDSVLNIIKEYLDLFHENEKKLIAINKIEGDIKNCQIRAKLDIENEPMTKSIYLVEAREGKGKIRDYILSYYRLLLQAVNSRFKEKIEFSMLDDSPKLKRTKPSKDIARKLNQNQLMYLFKLLANNDVFTPRISNMQLARGIESVAGYRPNKTREKGKILSVEELRKIKEVVDKISKSLEISILDGGIK